MRHQLLSNNRIQDGLSLTAQGYGESSHINASTILLESNDSQCVGVMLDVYRQEPIIKSLSASTEQESMAEQTHNIRPHYQAVEDVSLKV